MNIESGEIILPTSDAPKTLTELRLMNLEKGYGARAKEIAACIGEDSDLDEMVTRVSSKRFKEIINAYKDEAIKESRAEKAELLPLGGKVFKDTNDYYLANRYIQILTIEALEQGGFRVPDEKSTWEKAKQGKIDLMRYLIEIDSPHAEALSNIIVDEPVEALTLDKFMDSRKQTVREAFSSYRNEEYKDDRFKRIFAPIKKEAIALYESFIKDEARRVRKGEPLLSLEQKVNLCIQQNNKQSEQQAKALEHIEYIDNTFNKKAHYAHTLQQKHDYIHSK